MEKLKKVGAEEKTNYGDKMIEYTEINSLGSELYKQAMVRYSSDATKIYILLLNADQRWENNVLYISEDLWVVKWLQELYFNNTRITEYPKDALRPEVLKFIDWSDDNFTKKIINTLGGVEYFFLKKKPEVGIVFERNLENIKDIKGYLQILFYKAQCAYYINEEIKKFQIFKIPDINQQMFYIHKYLEAKEFLATDYPADHREKFPMIYNESLIKGLLDKEVAEEIVHRYNIMHGNIARFDKFKMVYFEKIKKCSDLNQLNTILKEFNNEYHKATQL